MPVKSEHMGPAADYSDKQNGFRGRSIIGQHFMNSDLSGADLSEVNFTRSTFVSCDLRDANCSGSSFDGVNMVRSDLRRVNGCKCSFRLAVLLNCRLDGADLRGTDFRHADLRGTEMQSVALGGADLRGCLLEGASMHRASYSAETCFPETFDPVRHGMIREDDCT